MAAMNTPATFVPRPRPQVANPNVALVDAARRAHRARDFGVGYGSSSGYASGRRYADNWGNPRFRCG